MTSLLAFFPVEAQMPLGMFVVTIYIWVILLARPYLRKGLSAPDGYSLALACHCPFLRCLVWSAACLAELVTCTFGAHCLLPFVLLCLIATHRRRPAALVRASGAVPDRLRGLHPDQPGRHRPRREDRRAAQRRTHHH